MKRGFVTVMAGAAAIVASMGCVAADGPFSSKAVPIGGSDVCDESKNEALACVIQCDAGTRPAFARRFESSSAGGVEACRVFNCVCSQVARTSSAIPRPGFLVQDVGRGDLAMVIFGVDTLMKSRSPAGTDFGAGACSPRDAQCVAP